MNSLILAALLASIGAADVWVVDASVRVFPDSRPPRIGDRVASLSAAKGEYECFQIAVRADKGGLENVLIDFDPEIDSPISAPEIFVVGYVDSAAPAADGATRVWPDPLFPPEPVSILPNETRAFWIVYRVKDTAPTGFHEAELRVMAADKMLRIVRASFDIFDFALPGTPSLSAYFTLDRGSIRRTYGIDDLDLQRWQPVYDVLAPYRLAYRLWDGGPLLDEESPDAAELKNHLAYALAVTPMRVADIGPGVVLSYLLDGKSRLGEKPQASGGLGEFLNDMGEWLDAKGLGGRGLVEVATLEGWESWQESREAYARYGQLAPAIQRMIVAPLHPYWERDVDVWAIPFADYHPEAVGLMRAGRSFGWTQSAPAVAAASSSATEPTEAIDAYDGSLFSAWVPADRDSRPWLRFELAQLATIETVRLAWKRDSAPDTVRLSTSRDGRSYSNATVSWRRKSAHYPYDWEWWEGRLRVTKGAQFIRLGIDRAVGEAVALAEISIDESPQYPVLDRQRPIAPWLAFEPDIFPSLRPDAHPLEHRLRPWICWAYGVDGFAGGSLTTWSRDLVPRELAAPEPGTFPAFPAGAYEQCLLYAGNSAPIPSIRLMHLRDGIEDYEYFVALVAAFKKIVTDAGTAPPPWVQALGIRSEDVVEAARRDPNATLDLLRARRIEMGRTISDIAAGRAWRDPGGFAR